MRDPLATPLYFVADGIDCIHRPSFIKQYEDFWNDPPSVDILWLGLLMIMMSTAIHVLSANETLPPVITFNPVETSLAFRAAAEQCMIVGNYTKKLYLHTVQTLILLAISTTPHESSWFFLGTVIRVAMSMGLHRDPGNFPAISAGEGEMRRRLWNMIKYVDLLTSVHMGMPHMIKEEECDSKVPLNLHDSDVDVHITTLPAERPASEQTGVSYMIAKALMAEDLA